jgi:hypothetical protein
MNRKGLLEKEEALKESSRVHLEKYHVANCARVFRAIKTGRTTRDPLFLYSFRVVLYVFI